MDTLRFCVAIPQRFYLSDLYELTDASEGKNGPEYILQSVVCFLGAHYMSYVKKKGDNTDQSLPMWKLYDDDKPVQIYMSWKEIMEKILEFGTLPTVLVYEKVHPQNTDNDAFDKMSSSELYQLDKRAYNLQKFIDQYEIAEAKAKMN